MKHRRISIKWRIYGYFLVFTAILLLILWLLQVVYLEKFYQKIKKNELNNAMDSVIESLDYDENTIDSAINAIAENYDVCILIADKAGSIIYSAETNTLCTIHFFNTQTIKNYYLDTRANGNEMLIETVRGEEKDFLFPEKDNNFEEETLNNDILNQNGDLNEKSYISIMNPDRKSIDDMKDRFDMKKLSDMESLISIKIIDNASGQEYIVFVDSLISPVDSTIHTIRIQLVYITAILVVISLLIALLLAKRISSPIININKSAKRLSKGDFETTFNEKNYKEIAELSDTLNHAAVELGKAGNIQRELIANVSHDLRTPLTMITAYSEGMRDLPGENTPENIQVIIDEAKRLSMLVNDLLDISKLQAGVAKLDIKEYNLTDAIESVIMRYSKLIEQDGYIIEFKYDKDVFIEADEFKIYQVIYNLVNNAINYTGNDKKVIVKQIIKNDFVRIEVSDTGKGIEKEEIKNVWERYYKIDKTHKRAVMGTGLGLSIVKNILVNHNAKFGVESKIGKGSTFWFELKIKSF